jgi:RND family efflux transporter MFP subunit
MMSPFDSDADNSTLAGLWRQAPARLQRRPWIAGALALAAVAVLAFFALRPGVPTAPVTEPRTALTVTTIGLETRAMKSGISGVGSVVAWQELSVGAEAPGLRVVEVLVDEGDDVKAGQVLARLDSRVLNAQLRAQDARVAEARANVIVADNNLKRAEELVRRGVVSSSTLDDRKSAADTAAARLAAAVASRDELAARVAQTNIVAPADGHISARSILIGDVVNAGTEAFKLIRDNRLELDAQIAETDLGGIAPGQQATVTHEGNAPVVGTVRMVAPTVDAKSRLGTVHIALPANSGLRVGMYARAEITLADAPVQALPETALVWRDGKAIVFAVAADGHVSERAVETGARQGNWVEIRSGLARGEQVVGTGAGFLHDGDRVRVNNAGAPAAPNPEAVGMR